MLLQFKVKNFQSIKDEAILRIVPSVDRSHPENLAREGNREAIKTSAIYGANAAGKSAVIRTFVAAIMTMRTSDTRNITQKIPGMVPFKFDEGVFSKYKEKNTPNKLFLATATNWGNIKTAPAYQWLANAIDVYYPELAIQPTAL